MFGVVGVCLAAHAQTQSNWTPEFTTQNSDRIEPTGKLELLIPGELSAETISLLALELDGVDVSEIVELEESEAGYLISVTPPQPLDQGSHELRLVEYTNAGEILERGAWAFGVSGIDTRTFSSNIELSGGYRLDDNFDQSNFLDDEETEISPDKFGVQGSVQATASVNGEQWSSQADVDLVIQSEREGIDGDDDEALDKDIELGEYLFTGEKPGLSAMIGHHALSHQGLLMQDFHRRGVSFNKSHRGGYVNASGFAFRSEPILGWRQGLGVGDEENRVVGGALSLNPFGNDDKSLNITTMYLRGEGAESDGVGVAGSENLSSGDGLSLIAESHLFDERFKLRIETAATVYDFDADATEFESEQDNAHSLLTSFTPWRTGEEADIAGAWEIGAEIQQVEQFFHSLANPTLPTDRTLTRLYSSFNLGGLSVQAQVANEEDNVADDAALPVLQNDISELAVSYTPPLEYDDEDNPDINWYGHPSFSISAQSGDLSHKRLSPDEADFRIDQSSPNYQTEMAFQYPTWSWNIGYGWGEEQDNTGEIPDQENELLSFSANWTLRERIELATYIQTNDLSEDDQLSNRSQLWGVSAFADIVPDKLNIGFDYSLNRDTSSIDLTEVDTQTLGLNIDWQLVPPRNNRSGFTLSLRGEQQQIKDRLNPDNDEDPFQVLLGLRMNWPVTYPRY